MKFSPEHPPFWRSEPLNERECGLLNALCEAHAVSVFRDNASSVLAINAAVGSGRYANGIAAACMSIGGVHAPLAESMALLQWSSPEATAEAMLEDEQKVPGWGNSFVRRTMDPDWLEMDRVLRAEATPLMAKVDAVTAVLHRAGKNIYPNPSTYTAIVALIVRIPPALAPFLFIASRLEGWSELIARHLK